MSNHFGLHEKCGVKEMKIRLSGSDRDEFLSKTEEFVISCFPEYFFLIVSVNWRKATVSRAKFVIRSGFF